jgi:uncharacterized membrane protein YhiD involved in acid resistance
MKKISINIAIGLFISLFTVLFIFTPSLAQDDTVTETDTFDDPQLEGWGHTPEVVVSDGVLQIYSGQFAERFGDWGDFDLTLQAKFSGEGEIVIGYHFRGEGRYVLHTITGEVILVREVTEPFTELGRTNITGIAIGEWFDVRIVLAGGEHEVYINNELVLSVSETDPLSPGRFILHVTGETIGEFDNLTITGQKTAFIPEGEPGMEGEPWPGEGEPEPGQEPPPEGEPGGISPTTSETGIPTGDDLTLFEEFFSSQATTFELSTFAINLLLAVVTSFILSRVYIYWGSSLSNRRVFAANFMLMTVTTTFIILVVRSSVALSLGLVGALSIVRFRAAVKEPEELAYLFFAIGLGIGLGDNQRLITLLTLVVAIVIIGLMKLLRNTKADVNLHLTVSNNAPNKVELEQIMGVLEKHCSKLKLLRLDENSETVETSFVIEFKKVSDLNQAKAELQSLSDTMNISFLDNKGIW